MRLRRLEEEFAGQVEFEWKSYLLRPRPRSGRDPEAALEKFRAYTRSWMRPAADPDGGEFRVWATDEPPPSHSIPPHLVSKAARRISKDAFERLHERLMRAYFAENRDITSDANLLELWKEVGLPEEAFETRHDPSILEEVVDDHNEALSCGATGAPAMRLADNPAAITGAHPIELYRHWIERSLARRAEVQETS